MHPVGSYCTVSSEVNFSFLKHWHDLVIRLVLNRGGEWSTRNKFTVWCGHSSGT